MYAFFNKFYKHLKKKPEKVDLNNTKWGDSIIFIVILCITYIYIY